ncbi:putative atp-dependent rna helicase mss116 protein [Erysiphe necator]|uniref:ATP-dependent RNA helicase n=1 Tax=Uncinula necator TaxID=52586 RepID=A0A0B1P721_UNCNE|nr:putative atp-dependent rna helicase mss116 protein [Erysiphe necator]
MASALLPCRKYLLTLHFEIFPTLIFEELFHRETSMKRKYLRLTSSSKNFIRNYNNSQGFKTISTRASIGNLKSDENIESTTFQDLGNENRLHPKLVKTLSDDLKFDTMMPIQAATIQDLLDHRVNCLAQAKTGTGKTIAFLLPAIQTLVTKEKNIIPGKHISLLVISPTRELALQIAKEAQGLSQRFPKFTTHVCIGGTNKEKEQREIIKKCDILIATPGRLLDHLIEPNFVKKLETLDTLVLDEADRLLDMGFMKDIERIVHYLPDKIGNKRQGMLFSATITPRINKVADLILGQDYKFITTIPAGEKLTHEKVLQKLIIVPGFPDLAPALVSSILHDVQSRCSGVFKAIIFAPTTALADFYHKILRNFLDISYLNVIHSRTSQGKRNKTIAEFRQATNGVLVATDIVARGIDIPAVTNVIQVGLPMNKESYIHRLGRTARAGNYGEGTFILTEAEKFFISKSMGQMDFIELPADLNLKTRVIQDAATMEQEKHKKIYQSFIGYYKNHLKAIGWTPQHLVVLANKFAKEGLGASEIPMLTKETISKLGLRGMHGFNVKPKKVKKSKEKLDDLDATKD